MTTAATFGSRLLGVLANNAKILMVAYGLTLVFGTLMYWQLEAYSLVQCLEWAVQSSNTTGYGNYPAQTVAGSLFSSFYMLWGGTVLATFLVSLIVNLFRKDPDNFSDAEQKYIMLLLELICKRLGIELPKMPH